METLNAPTFLKEERGQTDESLTAERGRTDESLLQLRKNAERETDKEVKKDRNAADQTRAQRRSDADLDRKSDEQNSQKDKSLEQQAEQQAEQKNRDDRFLEQRQLDDDTVEVERSRMDAAIRKERVQKDAVVTKFLDRERGETDENLLHEREQTDSQVQKSSERLSEEKISHSTTQEELTTRNEFVAIVSHDLRNPLGTILSFSKLLLEDPIYAKGNDEAKSWIEIIKRNAEVSLRLISDILDMERVVEGKLELQLRQHDLGGIVRDSVESFAQIASARKISLRALPSDVSAFGICDQDRVAQVLSNLIGNAIKFTPDGGSVTVKLDQTERELQISVSDSGPGIANEQLKWIFDRYAQLSNKDRQGLGLGLYISKMLIEAHKGRLSVESSLGKGSTFHFSLPRAGLKS